MEHQVADLAQRALLRRDRAVPGGLGADRDLPPGAPPSGQAAADRGDDLVRALLAGRLGVVGQAGQVAGDRDRLGAQPTGLLEAARHQAADQRDEQQQVSRREPRGGEDVERAHAVQDRGEVWVLHEVVADRIGARGALREHRTRQRSHGEQEQQDQRSTHPGQPAPGVTGHGQHVAAQRAAAPGRRRPGSVPLVAVEGLGHPTTPRARPGRAATARGRFLLAGADPEVLGRIAAHRRSVGPGAERWGARRHRAAAVEPFTPGRTRWSSCPRPRDRPGGNGSATDRGCRRRTPRRRSGWAAR